MRYDSMEPWVVVAVVFVGLLGALYALGNWGNNNDEPTGASSSQATATPTATPEHRKKKKQRATRKKASSTVALRIEATGPQLLKAVLTHLRRAFPDLHVSVEDLIEEGDKIVARNTVTGTHQGEYMGIPATGTRVTYDEIFIVRFAGGRIAETWGVVDVFSQMKQLGAIPA